MLLNKKESIEKIKIFDKIEKSSIEKLINIAFIKKIKKSEHLFRDKEKVEYIYIVLSGKVTLYKINESSHKKIIFILGENKIINGVIIDDLPASINCEAFEDSEILCFPKEGFIEVMKSDFNLTRIVIESLSKKVRRLYRQSKNSIPIKIEKKLAAKLWKLSKDYGVETKNGTLIDINITVTYLAEMFGMPRETLSRALKILVENKLVINDKRKIIIPDREVLAKFFKEN